MKVYIVYRMLKWSYTSDWEMIKVFSNLDKAKKYTKDSADNYSGYKIEEIEFN